MARAHIPADVKQKVRQRCGFGCIFCGVPLFAYDHLIPYAKSKEHNPNNINLLCPNHHAKKTRGLLDEDAVRTQARAPINKGRSGTGRLPLEMKGDTFLFEAGCNRFSHTFTSGSDSFNAVVLGGTRVVGVNRDEGWLTLDLELVDILGAQILHVESGELTVSTALRDFEHVGKTFRLSQANEPVIEVEIAAQNHLKLNRGRLFRNGRGVNIEPDFARLFSYSFNMFTNTLSQQDGARFKGNKLLSEGEGSGLYYG